MIINSIDLFSYFYHIELRFSDIYIMSQNNKTLKDKAEKEIDSVESQLEEVQKEQSQEKGSKGQSQEKEAPFSHPVWKKISATNGRINRMTQKDLTEALEYLKLSSKGTTEVLQKRLKSYTKKQYLTEAEIRSDQKKYTDFYIVIDFEATCEEPNPPGFFHEIIEFPAILVNAETNEIVSEFHHYCRPRKNPILSDFCKQLTGITQIQVESASTFETVLKRFDVWLKEQVTPEQKFVIATDGPWDIDRFLKTQCRSLKINIPHYFHRWVNIRKHFTNFYRLNYVNVETMLSHLGLTFQGRPHSGIDDSRNIARILVEMRKDGAEMIINETFRS